MRFWRRNSLALAISLALHLAAALVLVWLFRGEPKAEKPKATAIRLVVVPRDFGKPPAPPARKPPPKAPPPLAQAAAPAPEKPARPTPERAPKPLPPAVAQAPKPVPEQASNEAEPPHPQAPQPAASPLAQAAMPAAAPQAPGAGGNRDSPRALKLMPDPLPFATAGPPPPEESHGHTLHNVPGELPDPEAVAAVQAQQAKRKIEGWINDELAEIRVENGLVDGYFGDLRHALEKETAHLPLMDERGGSNFVQQLAKSWLEGAKRYASSGNPYSPGMGPEPHPMGGLQTPLEREAERYQGTSGQVFQQTVQAGARLREFGDGRFGAGLLAIVEIQQNGQGKLTGTLLLQPSGNKSYDDYVMKSAPAAVGAMPAPPPKGAGLHTEGIRSTWAFEGRITYKKKLSDMTLAKDGWYLAGMLPLSMLNGNFDEVTGVVEVVDLRNPQFVCKVRLLKVY